MNFLLKHKKATVLVASVVLLFSGVYLQYGKKNRIKNTIFVAISKKELGKTIAKEEDQAVKTFYENNNKCLSNVDSDHLKKINKLFVDEYAKDNTKTRIFFTLNDLEKALAIEGKDDLNKLKISFKQIKKCHNESRKKVKSIGLMKEFKNGQKKLDMMSKISLFFGNI